VLQVALLGNCDHETAEAAYEYGKNLGISFQVSKQSDMILYIYYVNANRSWLGSCRPGQCPLNNISLL